MRFKMHRNRTISSTCGLSIEFVKDQLHLVPPAMYAEVIAAANERGVAMVFTGTRHFRH